MISVLNVKMLILNDEQKAIHHIGAINEPIARWHNFRTGLLYKQ
jgi:hypothetical protein